MRTVSIEMRSGKFLYVSRSYEGHDRQLLQTIPNNCSSNTSDFLVALLISFNKHDCLVGARPLRCRFVVIAITKTDGGQNENRRE